MASPLSARTVRGAIIAIDPTSPPRAIPFQYNPDTVTRSLTPHEPPADGASANPRRVWGAPKETITLTLDLDAGDSAADGRALAGVGVRARLAALQLLVAPSIAHVIAGTAQQMMGIIEILPPTAPLTVLSLGPTRTVPIAVESLTITELAHDAALVPIRATAQVQARVLTYSDLPVDDPGHVMSIAQQLLDEAAALLTPVVSTAEAV